MDMSGHIEDSIDARAKARWVVAVGSKVTPRPYSVAGPGCQSGAGTCGLSRPV